jgi:hypothetical protein
MARRRVWALRQQFERRWKEMWDDATGRPFYHDKNTGEIRWRRPQHLLNQLPKPTCTNCEEQLAIFECKDCVEFFCITCWPQVHFGGRRKHHLHRQVVFSFLFVRCHCLCSLHWSTRCVTDRLLLVWDAGAVVHRPLYDRYGLRVDYGEGEWPSVWPTEIQQDEIKGWSLVSDGSSAAHAQTYSLAGNVAASAAQATDAAALQYLVRVCAPRCIACGRHTLSLSFSVPLSNSLSRSACPSGCSHLPRTGCRRPRRIWMVEAR